MLCINNFVIVKKQIDVSFSCVCPVIDNEFRQNIAKLVDPHPIYNVMTQFIINNRTDPLKTEVNLLNGRCRNAIWPANFRVLEIVVCHLAGFSDNNRK